MAKRFINEPANVVSDAMGGLALDSCRVSMLDSSTGHNVAVRTSLISKSYTPRVSVLSGGGSGHEPMAMGYVGEGMLAGAVAGDVFAAPPVDAVSALLDVIAPHSTGILFLVMNYQGDRLSFGMSVKEFSKKTDKPIHITYISDDVAKPAAKDNRGISGTIFVIKVAGAAADRGLNFKEVIKIAEAASRSIVSYGVALEPATVPGQPVDIESISSDESTLLSECIIYLFILFLASMLYVQIIKTDFWIFADPLRCGVMRCDSSTRSGYSQRARSRDATPITTRS